MPFRLSTLPLRHCTRPVAWLRRQRNWVWPLWHSAPWDTAGLWMTSSTSLLMSSRLLISDALVSCSIRTLREVFVDTCETDPFEHQSLSSRVKTSTRIRRSLMRLRTSPLKRVAQLRKLPWPGLLLKGWLLYQERPKPHVWQRTGNPVTSNCRRRS